jgi:glycosyltransferase involved in cell wall biosynthesis/SAM-dependent methyltransferase
VRRYCFNPADVSPAHVLWVVHYPVFGGPHNEALMLAGPLAGLGWELEVLIPDERGNAGDRLERSGMHVERLPLARLRATPRPSAHVDLLRRGASDVRAIRRLLREREIDVVVVGGLVNPQAALAARREGSAVVWKVLDTRAPVALRAVMVPWVLAYADVAMSTGRRVADVHPGLNRLGDRLIPYFPPVDLTLFRPDDQARRSARAELGIADGDVVVGTVGNLSPMKRHGDLVAAAALLRTTHPAARFAILGSTYGHRTGYVDRLLREADELGVELIVADPGDNVARLAQALDVFWLSSDRRSEGVPTTVGEAMALGIPVVATDVGGIAETLDDGRTGYVVEPRRPDRLAAATRPLLDDPAKRQSLGAAGRERARELFDVDHCAALHERAFRLASTRARLRGAAHLNGRPSSAAAPEEVSASIRCPGCRGSLGWRPDSAECTACAVRYPIVDGIPVLVADGTDAHKQGQAAYFDHVEPEFEVMRPHGTPRVYRWLLGEKFRRSVSALEDVIGGARVLTVCGGSGMDAEFLARAANSVVAADISLEAARRTRERARRFGLAISPVVADVERLPFADRSFDVVYVHDGLHHLERPLAGLHEMARVAGRAVSINEPARATATRLAVRVGFSYDFEDAGNRVERIDPEELAAALQADGFSVVRVERYAMYYRHEPGAVLRVFSREPLYTALRLSLTIFNRVAGSVGNKSTIQAVRPDRPRED